MPRTQNEKRGGFSASPVSVLAPGYLRQSPSTIHHAEPPLASGNGAIDYRLRLASSLELMKLNFKGDWPWT